MSKDAHEALIERAAQEIWLTEPKRIGSRRLTAWEHESEETRDKYRPLARAVIALIAEETKEPSAEMLEAASAHLATQMIARAVWYPMQAASALWPRAMS